MCISISGLLLARIAGFLYLLIIAGRIFTEVFVRQELMISGDPIATANNIQMLVPPSTPGIAFMYSMLF